MSIYDNEQISFLFPRDYCNRHRDVIKSSFLTIFLFLSIRSLFFSRWRRQKQLLVVYLFVFVDVCRLFLRRSLLCRTRFWIFRLPYLPHLKCRRSFHLASGGRKMGVESVPGVASFMTAATSSFMAFKLFPKRCAIGNACPGGKRGRGKVFHCVFLPPSHFSSFSRVFPRPLLLLLYLVQFIYSRPLDICLKICSISLVCRFPFFVSLILFHFFFLVCSIGLKISMVVHKILDWYSWHIRNILYYISIQHF